MSTIFTTSCNHWFLFLFRNVGAACPKAAEYPFDMLSMARYSQQADWGTSWVARKLPCFGLHDCVSVFLFSSLISFSAACLTFLFLFIS